VTVAPPTGPLIGGVTVTLLSSYVSGRDEYGVDVRNETRTQVPGCAMAPGTTTEDIQGTTQVDADATLYMPSGTVVTPEDHVLYQGVRYRVMGAPQTWTSPFTALAGPVAVRLKVVTGAAR